MAEPEVAFLLFSKFAEANEDEMRELLGGVSVQSLAHEISPARHARIKQITALWVDLADRYPAIDAARDWLHEPNAQLAGRTPWAAMLAGDVAAASELIK